MDIVSNRIYEKYGKYYDLIYSAKDYVEECGCIEKYLKHFSMITVKKILDIGCGTGSHAIVLAKRGYRVVGIDPSRIMIDQAKIKGAGLPVKFYVQDMRQFRLDETFDLVICMFGTFDYLITDEDVRNALRAIRRHMRSEALFIFDFWPVSAYSMKERWRHVL
jgi:2-polyprenyl-3-methyl-5-hydroxy-6-metoxy-1,4-benzoquinol methylase